MSQEISRNFISSAAPSLLLPMDPHPKEIVGRDMSGRMVRSIKPILASDNHMPICTLPFLQPAIVDQSALLAPVRIDSLPLPEKIWHLASDRLRTLSKYFSK